MSEGKPKSPEQPDLSKVIDDASGNESERNIEDGTVFDIYNLPRFKGDREGEFTSPEMIRDFFAAFEKIVTDLEQNIPTADQLKDVAIVRLQRPEDSDPRRQEFLKEWDAKTSRELFKTLTDDPTLIERYVAALRFYLNTLKEHSVAHFSYFNNRENFDVFEPLFRLGNGQTVPNLDLNNFWGRFKYLPKNPEIFEGISEFHYDTFDEKEKGLILDKSVTGQLSWGESYYFTNHENMQPTLVDWDGDVHVLDKKPVDAWREFEKENPVLFKELTELAEKLSEAMFESRHFEYLVSRGEKTINDKDAVDQKYMILASQINPPLIKAYAILRTKGFCRSGLIG